MVESRSPAPPRHRDEVSDGDPAQAICEAAERLDAECNKRVQGLARVLGSVAGDVTMQAPCDVYLAKTRSESAD